MFLLSACAVLLSFLDLRSLFSSTRWCSSACRARASPSSLLVVGGDHILAWARLQTPAAEITVPPPPSWAFDPSIASTAAHCHSSLPCKHDDTLAR